MNNAHGVFSTGADPDIFERGGVDLNMAFDVVRKRISRASKWQRLEVSISIRTDFSCYLLIFLMQFTTCITI